LKTGELSPAIQAALKKVYDPEIPVDIWELGLILRRVCDRRRRRGDSHDPDRAGLPGGADPPGPGARRGAQRRRRHRREVDVVWEPGWTKDRMSDAAKLQLGMW